MVTELFTRIRQLLRNPARFLCILIDEVESLAAARSAAMAGSDPSDAIRVSGALAGDSHDAPCVARSDTWNRWSTPCLRRLISSADVEMC